MTDIDGGKSHFRESGVQLVKSITDPIIRTYSEAETMEKDEKLAEEIKAVIASL